MKTKNEQFKQRLLKMYPHLKDNGERLYVAVSDAMEFAESVKTFGSFSFAITQWRNNGGRHDNAFLNLANKIFN
jgi:hypothetical protein